MSDTDKGRYLDINDVGHDVIEALHNLQSHINAIQHVAMFDYHGIENDDSNHYGRLDRELQLKCNHFHAQIVRLRKLIGNE